MTLRKLYLNHAGTSWPKPKVVADAVQQSMLLSPAEWPQRFAEAHQEIADFFGVARPEQLLLTPGCTSALAIAIGDVILPPGKRVLTSRWEHHALHRPLQRLPSTDGGPHVEYIPAKRDGTTPQQVRSIDLDWLEQTLSHENVGLVAITAACNVTGETLPYTDVIRLAHRHGALVLIDAAQVVGWLPLDLPKLGADIVAFGGHKGLQGPWGIGGLYLSDDVPLECFSANCALPVAGDNNHRPSLRPGYCDVGSVDQFALAGLRAAVHQLRQHDLPGQLSKARQQIQQLRLAVDSFSGVQIYGAFPDGMPSLAFMVAGRSSTDLAALLAEHGLIVGSGLQCAALAHETLGTLDSGLVRLSVGVGQPDEQIDEAASRIQSAAAGLRRAR